MATPHQTGTIRAAGPAPGPAAAVRSPATGGTLLGSLTVYAHPARVPGARRWTGQVLAGRACREDAEQCVTELVTNSVCHTATRHITLLLVDTGTAVRGEVVDAGGVTVPRAARRADCAETVYGRGLFLVERLASRWGREECDTGQITWFELDDPAP